MGEVASPGALRLAPGTTFWQGLSQAGHLTRFAATGRIQLRSRDASGRAVLSVHDYRALSEGGEMDGDPRLRDGDVILVPERRLFE